MKKLLLFLKKFGLILNIFAATALLMAYLAPFISPDVFWPLSFFGLLYPFLLFLNVFFLIFWLIQKSGYFLLSTIVVFIGITHITHFIQFKAHKKNQEQGIKLLSYNVNYFSYNRKNNKNNSQQLIQYLNHSSADIICLQEAAIPKAAKKKGMQQILPEMKHYQFAHSVSFGGPVTFSKFPIINYGEIRFANTANMIIFSDIKIDEHQKIRVYNCHFQSFQIRPDDYTIIETPSSGSNRLKLKEIFEISRKLVSAFSIRAHQARTIARHIKSSPYPVVICGDFNDTPWSYTYHTVMDHLKDAFVESGFGLSNTYNGKLPSFRIDYILHSNQYSSYNYQRDRVPYSDHFPISCFLQLKKKN